MLKDLSCALGIRSKHRMAQLGAKVTIVHFKKSVCKVLTLLLHLVISLFLDMYNRVREKLIYQLGLFLVT